MEHKQMLFNRDEISSIYCQLADANELALVASDNDSDLFIKLIISFIIEVIGPIGYEKSTHPQFSDDLFKDELNKGLIKCLCDETIVSKYGVLWLAQDGVLIGLMDFISNSVTKYTAIAEENRQALLN